MADRMILGEGVVYSTDSNETGLNNNVIVCGGTGCGKTMSIAEPRILETMESSLVVTVTKRRLVRKYSGLLKKRGYDVQEQNFINPSESDVAYDPLAYIRTAADVSSLRRHWLWQTRVRKSPMQTLIGMRRLFRFFRQRLLTRR